MTARQREILLFLAEREHVPTEELLETLGIDLPEFAPEIKGLLERRLVLTAVPTLGSGVWWITPKGRDLVGRAERG